MFHTQLERLAENKREQCKLEGAITSDAITTQITNQQYRSNRITTINSNPALVIIIGWIVNIIHQDASVFSIEWELIPLIALVIGI